MTKRTRRRLIILLSLFLLLLIPWLIWFAVELHRFNAALDDLRARSEPLSLSDLAPPPVPDHLNAAPLYLQAFHLLDSSPESDYAGLDTLLADPAPLSPDRLDQARLLLDRFSQPLDLLHRASFFPQCRFPIDYSLPPYTIRRPHVGPLLTSAQLLVLSSRVHLASNAPDLALDDCSLGFRLADSLRDDPDLVALFTRVRVHRLFIQQAALILDSSDPSPPALRSFLASLGDTSDRSHFVRALKADRCRGIALINDLFNNRISPDDLRDMGLSHHPSLTRLGVFVARPLLMHDAVHYLRIMNDLDSCTSQPSHLCSAHWGSLFRIYYNRTGGFRLSHPVCSMLVPAVAHSVDGFDRDLALRSSAAQAVALRLYRLAHGAYPASLSALVPDFLPALPLDPFSGDPFAYRLEPPGFLLYSLGSNLTDEGGVSDSSDHDTGDITWRSSR